MRSQCIIRALTEQQKGDPMTKAYQIGDLFTQEEIDAAIKLYVACRTHEFATRCDAEVVAPVLQRINKVTGQQNSSRYLAYMLQSVFMNSMER